MNGVNVLMKLWRVLKILDDPLKQLTLDELIARLHLIRLEVSGNSLISCRNTDGEWDQCGSVDWLLHPVHGCSIQIESTNKFATG